MRANGKLIRIQIKSELEKHSSRLLLFPLFRHDCMGFKLLVGTKTPPAKQNRKVAEIERFLGSQKLLYAKYGKVN